MTGCLAENTLVELVEGRLGSAATASLHRHVDRCSSCRALLKEVGGAFFASAPPSPSARSLAEHSSLALPIAEPSQPPSKSSLRESPPRRARKVALHPGDRVGKYRIVRQVGVGGMGVVFEALHEQLRRRVAVKVLYPHYAENPQMVARLLNEARAANLVRHPAIVSSFEVGHLPGGEAYLVMEYLDGEPLRLRLQRLGGRLGPSGLRVLRQVASAMQAAHGWGVIHRDLKPANVMLVPDPEMAGGERVKILDFGLAKVGAELREEGEEFSTHAGAILGTPAYMAPEQCQEAAAVDDRADVYSMGVILFECVSGRLPFSAKGAVDLMAMHIYVPAPSLSEAAPEAPAALVELVGRMLRKAPVDRPTMAEVAAALERLDGGPDLGTGHERGTAETALPQVPRRRPATLLLLGVSCALALAAGLRWVRTAAAPPPHLSIGLAAPFDTGVPAAPPPSSAVAAASSPMAAAPVESAAPVSPEGPVAPSPPVVRPDPPAPAATRPRAAPFRGPRKAARPEPEEPRRAPPPPPPPPEEWTDEKIRLFR